MNVTSLLNTSAAAAAQHHAANASQRKCSLDQTPTPSANGGTTMCSTAVPTPSPERTPPSRQSSASRSRTPWDAGGYSLPLTLNTKNIQSTSTSKPSFYSDSPMDISGPASPKSPRHRFSDSRSSLSSYTTTSSNNSSNSQSHSRISSLSTVSEYQPLSNFTTDMTHLERRMSDLDSAMSCHTVVEIHPPSLAKRTSFEDNSSAGSSPRDSDRPRSPSDAVLNRMRGQGGSLSPHDGKYVNSFLRPDSPSSVSLSRSHKRAVSAPDFPPLNTPTLRTSSFPSFGPMAEPTPPKSPQADERHESVVSDSNTSIAPAESSKSIQVAAAAETTEQPQPKCMFVNDCTTGSTLRKAISHIFGRNKLCTKSIPAHIWVHYCRKHYQRSRYRNATDYAKRQCELVLIQINQVQGWSDDNVKSGRRGDGVLRHWTLQARKREAKRLQDQDSRKRRFAEEEDDEEDGDRAVTNGTAIPHWLQSRINRDYTTDEIRVVVTDIQTRMENNEIQQIPDIEILPDIITDGNESRPKTTVRRTPNGAHHRHTKSEIPRPSAGSMFPNPYGTRNSMSAFSDNKRFRTGPGSFLPIQNMAMRPSMNMTPSYSYQMSQPQFATIAEHNQDPGFWSGNPSGYSHGGSQVLPAPVAQRQSSASIVPIMSLESNAQTYPQARPLHARSMSENPVFHNSPHNTHASFRPQSSHTHLLHQQQQQYELQQPSYNMAQGYGQPAHSYHQHSQSNASNDYYTPQVRDPNDQFFGSINDGSGYDAPRSLHSRVASTSSVHLSPVQRHPSMSAGASGLPPSTGPMGSLPHMSHMNHGAMMSNPGAQHYHYFGTARGGQQQHQQPMGGLSTVAKDDEFDQYSYGQHNGMQQQHGIHHRN